VESNQRNVGCDGTAAVGPKLHDSAPNPTETDSVSWTLRHRSTASNRKGLRITSNMKNLKTLLPMRNGSAVLSEYTLIGTRLLWTPTCQQPAAKKQQALDQAKDQYLAVMFLMNSDRNRYGSLVRNVENEYTRGTDTYPVTLSAAYDYIVNWPDGKGLMQDPDPELLYYTEDNEGQGHGGCGARWGRGRGHGNQGGRGGGRGGNPGRGATPSASDGRQPTTAQGRVHFEQDSGNDDSLFLMDNLDQVEHYSHVSTHLDFAGYTHQDTSDITILLDSCSTVNLITNKDLLDGIHKVPTTMRIRCNAGVTSTNLQGGSVTFRSQSGTTTREWPTSCHSCRKEVLPSTV
jgi:hypothetical protein